MSITQNITDRDRMHIIEGCITAACNPKDNVCVYSHTHLDK